ncbi:sulfatase-like hydrolase/transferase [Komagataeibacter europaeus]|uniref:sulfatase-like hydrolase/transferase n=2 Tax=Komagataeibacter europaeus TaxID=33995 RepID=UPI002FC2DECF
MERNVSPGRYRYRCSLLSNYRRKNLWVTARLPTADDYDRSIHRTDRILHNIMDMAHEKLGHYVLIYVSDHGEVVTGDAVGHALQYGGYPQYDIPMFMMDETGHYCDMGEKMRNQNGWFTSPMIKFLLLDMMGYKVDQNMVKALQHTDHVLHSDETVYDYTALPTVRADKHSH